MQDGDLNILRIQRNISNGLTSTFSSFKCAKSKKTKEDLCLTDIEGKKRSLQAAARRPAGCFIVNFFSKRLN